MKIFHATYEGPDGDFGPTHYPARITFEDDDAIWGESEIADAKQFLSDFYGCSLESVRTEEEHIQDGIDLNNYLDEEQKRLNNES